MTSFDFQDTRALAAGSLGDDVFSYRAEYLRLVDMAGSLYSFSRLDNGANVPDEG